MIIAYISVSDNKELDRVTISGGRVSYDTESAKPMIQASIRRLGLKATSLAYSNWSNGYVRTQKIG